MLTVCKLRCTSHLNERAALLLNVIFSDCNRADIVILWYLIHDIEHEILYNRTKGSGSDLFLLCHLGDGIECIVIELKPYLIHLKELLILLDNGILWLLQYLYKHILGESLK